MHIKTNKINKQTNKMCYQCVCITSVLILAYVQPNVSKRMPKEFIKGLYGNQKGPSTVENHYFCYISVEKNVKILSETFGENTDFW